MTDHASYLLAVDGSEASDRAEAYAIGLAKKTGAKLYVTHIIHWSSQVPIGIEAAYVRPLDKADEERRAKEEVLDVSMARIAEAGVPAESYFSWGSPAFSIKEKAQEWDVDMIIAGRKGRSNIVELIMGSVSNSLVHTAGVPVLLVP